MPPIGSNRANLIKSDGGRPLLQRMRKPLGCFNSFPAVMRLTVMMYIRHQLSLRQVADLLFEGGIYICHETVSDKRKGFFIHGG